MIIMHFPPGARGDFLGGMLLDCIVERDNFAIRHPPTSSYKKIHHTEDFTFLDDKSSIKIRIDANFNSVNLINIAINHILKNKPEIELNDQLDQHYMYIKDIINRDQLVYTHKDRYDYWIDFSAINDYNFLYDFYKILNKTTPDEKLMSSAIKNINKQLSVPTNYKKLSNLLDFEIKMNLLNLYRSFDYSEFINSSEPEQFLKLSNYSATKFIKE